MERREQAQHEAGDEHERVGDREPLEDGKAGEPGSKREQRDHGEAERGVVCKARRDNQGLDGAKEEV